MEDGKTSKKRTAVALTASLVSGLTAKRAVRCGLRTARTTRYMFQHLESAFTCTEIFIHLLII